MSAVPRPRIPPSIERWLARLGIAARDIEALTGDVSLRRYFRVRLAGGGTAIVAYYPVELRPACRRFRLTTALLSQAGVTVPAVRETDCRRGLMLLEDTGDRTLYDRPRQDWNVLAPVYRRAAEHLRRIRALPRAEVAGLSPRLDAALLRWELRKSWELCLLPRGLAGGPGIADAFAAGLDALCDELGREERQLPCHRDFMPRNLMLREDGTGSLAELVVLDHQDLRLGPPAYDLASLLNDSLFPPAWLEDELVSSLLPGPDGWLDYRRAVVQRSIKAAGNYCDFARRGFRRHLKLVEPTLLRAWRWFSSVPELRELEPALRGAWGALRVDLLD
jgi:hypothetical protein